LYVIGEKQGQIWAKMFCIPKSMHSRTPMLARTVLLNTCCLIYPEQRANRSSIVHGDVASAFVFLCDAPATGFSLRYGFVLALTFVCGDGSFLIPIWLQRSWRV